MKIEVRHLTRIEGHAHLEVDLERGELVACRLEVAEAPRFFEAILVGRPAGEVAPLASRICGVCSHSHTLASLLATEAALGVTVSEQTRGLRRLLAYGELLQSHLLHLYFLALPDYLGAPGLVPPAPGHRELATRALRMKKLANDLLWAVGGRPVHPVTPCVGGFAAVPEPGVLQGLRGRLVAALPDLEATVELFGGFAYPDLPRETELVALGGGGYPFLGDTLVLGDGSPWPAAAYPEALGEYLAPDSTAKLAATPRGAYRVGPQARLRHRFGALSPMAARTAAALGVTPGVANPYRAVLARVVEVVHCTEEALFEIDRLLLAGLAPEPPAEPRRGAGGGRGVGAVEAPRGLLLHAYRYDEAGRLVAADCLIPTAQSLGALRGDLAAAVRAFAHLPEPELTRRLELLLRAYDPCLSCATHRVTRRSP